MTSVQKAYELLRERLSPAAQQRLNELVDAVRADPASIERHFPAAAREVARGPLSETDPTGVIGPTLDDAVRGVLLAALAEARADEETLLNDVNELYRFGDGDEKRAVLRALGPLGLGEGARPLIADALRTNDVRIVGAAMGEWTGRHLDDAAWRQGVLKCLFVEVPLAAVHRLAERSDAELARMVAAFGHERVLAGRPVSADSHLVLDLFPEVLEQFPDVAAALGTTSAP